MQKMKREKMTGTFRRPITVHSATNLALEDAGHPVEIRDDYEYLSELAEKGSSKLFGKGYIEGDDHKTYYVSKEEAMDFSDGDRVEFEYIPRPRGERSWARNITKLK